MANENNEVKSSAAPLPELFKSVAPNYVAPDPYDAPSLRWGILGAGGIARTFAEDVPAYSSQQIVAVGSRDQSRADAFAAEIGIDPAGAHGSYEELVNAADIDIIYVATPHSRHYEDAILALQAGKPVLVEKAFTLTADKARRIFEEAAKRNLFAMEAMWSRHLPHYRFMDDVVQSGMLGPLRSVQADHSQKLTHVPRLVRPELGGGALLDLGVYPIHFEHMLLGVPEELASVSRLTKTGVDAADIVAGKYAQAIASATAALDAWGPTAASLSFERGVIELPFEFYRPTEVKLTVHELDPTTGAVASSENGVWDARVPGGFQYQAAEAARQVAAGNTESEIVSWQDTIEVMEIMDAVLKEAGVEHP